ncbi:MAG TPA: hypothetical protein DCX06_12600 [Opitutae bacterium]|nr:hypothetical protein [Opitutae bacterium]
MNYPYKKYWLLSVAAMLSASCLAVAQDEAPIIILPTNDEDVVDSAEATEATATTSEDANDEVFMVMPDFVVTAEQDRGYYSANSLAGTRTNALIKNTPMTISVVNQDLIQDLNLYGLDDLANVVPSVEAEGESFSNRLLRFRGLLTRFQLYEFMPRQLAQNGYNVERVEIVRGANSLIYGQAAPGGKANFLAKRADLSKNATSIDANIGSNNLFRSSFDTNYVINDKLAIRVMGVHQEQEYDQENKRQQFTGGTIAVTYRPTDKTQVQLHFEGVDAYRNSPPSIYQDKTSQYGYTGVLADLPASSEIVDLLDRSALNYIINYNDGFATAPRSNNNGQNNNRIPDFFTSKSDLEDFYERGILIPNPEDVDPLDPYRVGYGGRHSGTDSDKGGTLSQNERDTEGFFALADVTHSFTDDLQVKVAVSREEQYNDVLNRGDPRNLYLTQRANGGRAVQRKDGTGARAYADGFFVSPFWQKTENSDITTALRGTVSWNFDYRDTKHQLLFGLDLDRRDSSDEQESLLAVAPAGGNGFPFAGNTAAEDYFQISNGYPASGVGFDTNGDVTVGGNITSDSQFTQRSGRNGLGWFEKQSRDAIVDGQAIWLAAQSKFFNGRLNTLAGIRFDKINVKAEVNDYQSGLLNQEIDEDFNHVSPSFGGLFWINENLGFFANYAKSIESPNGWALDPLGNSVPAETGTGYEAGIKFEYLEGKLNGQLIVFHITKENERKSTFSNQILEVLYPFSAYPSLYPDATGPDDTGGIDPLGRNVAGSTVVSKGVELDLYYNPTPSLSIFLGYAYVESEFKETINGILDGQTLPGTANHSANLTVRYNFKDGLLKGWYVGANEKYRSRGLYDTLYEDVDFDGREDVLGADTTNDGLYDVAPKEHEIWLDYQLETAVFVGWRGKFAEGKKAPVWNIQFTVSNVFDDVRLISTGQARFTEGRTFNFKAGVKF